MLDAVRSYLQDAGWTVDVTPEGGPPDLLARAERLDLLVVAAGSRLQRAARRFATPHSRELVGSEIAGAIHGACKARDQHPRSPGSELRVAIAVPASNHHREYVKGVRSSLERLGIGVLWVEREPLTVHLDAPWSL